MNTNPTHNPFSPRRHPEQAKRAEGSRRPSVSDNPIRQHAQRASRL